MQFHRICLAVAGAVLYGLTSTASALDPTPLENAYWRMEDGTAGEIVPRGSNAVQDSVNGNHMERWTAPDPTPDMTSPHHSSDVPLSYVPGTGALNNLSLLFKPHSGGGGDDIYATGKNICDPLIGGTYNGQPNPVTAFTLEVSFKAASVGNYMTLVCKESTTDPADTTSPYPPLALKLMSSSDPKPLRLCIELRDHSNAVRVIPSRNPIEAGKWYHAVVVGTTTDLKYYLSQNDRNGYVLQNDAADGTDPMPITGGGPLYQGTADTYNTAWSIGKGMWDRVLADWFDGQIDEVRLSNVALSPCDFLFRPQPQIGQILLAGMTSVQLQNVHPSASAVKVYADGVLIGTNSAPGGSSSTMVNVSPALQNGQKVVATQVLSGCEGLLPPVGPVVGDCSQLPTVSPGMVDAGRTTVVVIGVDPLATAVKVYVDAGSGPVLAGANLAPAGASNVLVTVPPLVQGQTLFATQTVSSLESCVTAGRVVGPAGVIEDFEGAFSHQTNPTPGVDRTWYDVSNVAGTTAAVIPYFTGNGMQISDPGWTNGVYASYAGIIPAAGKYYLEMDMMVDETSPTANLDFLSTYQAGVIAQASPTHRTADGLLASVNTQVASNAVGNYWWLTPQLDGPPNETDYRRVHTKAFTANAGDGLLIAFSTTVTEGYSRGANASIPASTPPYPFMVVDNISLVAGEPPVDCHDVPTPRYELSPASTLEDGETRLGVGGLTSGPEPASLVSLYADGNLIATMYPSGAPSAIFDLTAHPLVAGQRLWTTQTVAGLESCLETTGPVVGTGKNSPIRVALGVRETGGAGPIGADGGTSGSIEWIGATAAVSGAPQGKLVGTGLDWQTVTFSSPLSGGNDPVLAFTGDGELTGAYGVLEHLAFTIAEPYNTGRYVIYIDRIMNGSTVLADFESPHVVGDLVMFRNPDQSSSTSGHILAYPRLAEVDTSRGANGSRQSYRIELQFYDGQPKRWLRLTTVDTDTTPDMPLQNPMIDLAQPITIRLLIYGPPDCGPVFADKGDSTPDGDVDMVDFAAFQRCVNTGGGAVLAGCECFDFDFNGSIDPNDLAAFSNCASGANVPAVPGCGH